MKNENEYIVRHITVAHCSHSDYSPPERVGNRLEEGAFGARFGKVDSTGEENDTCNKLQECYLISPQPTVVIVTTAHQKASGIDLKKDWSEPASAKYTADENSITPRINFNVFPCHFIGMKHRITTRSSTCSVLVAPSVFGAAEGKHLTHKLGWFSG